MNRLNNPQWRKPQGDQPRLSLVKRQLRRPTGEQIEKSLEAHVQGELREFAECLNAARWIWKNAPELLTAEQFPEPFRTAFIRANGTEPDERIPMLVDVTKPDLVSRLWPFAVKANLRFDDPLYSIPDQEIFEHFPYPGDRSERHA